jgi:alpha-D-ribose 1-methylphosphonate 5-phosphate C-P lyase
MKLQEKEVYKKTLELFDGVCAICGSNQVALHHIRYGSCGRKTYIGNVIPLCERHHRLVHSNKKKYQPILIEMINNKI